MTIKHTSGPWRYEPGRDGRPPYVIRGTEGGFVVVGMTAERQEADARLIAAAPDLLLALERITSSYRSLLARRPVRDVDETLAEVDAALAKARGET